MKNKYLHLLILVLLFAGCRQNHINDNFSKNDMQIEVFPKYEIIDSAISNFILEYLANTECENLNVFTLSFDQRMDTLLFTISSCPYQFPDKVFYFGTMRFKNKLVLLCSPFDNFIKAEVDSGFIAHLKQLNKMDLIWFSKRGTDSLLKWQLQKPYHGKTYFIEKDKYRIWTTKVPPPPPLPH